LYTLIATTLTGVRGLGELYCYDTALRIGAKLRLRPEAVFLHAGTRYGASLVADIRRLPWLNRADLPVGLQSLPPEQVEDILCIYADHIQKMRSPR
jgi:hypothetical protein